MKTVFEPYEDRILVRPLALGEKTAGGVHIPESARYLTAEGDVIAVGPGRTTPDGRTLPMRTKIGDRIKYTPYTGSSFKLDDEDVLVLREVDVLGLVRRTQEQSQEQASEAAA